MPGMTILGVRRNDRNVGFPHRGDPADAQMSKARLLRPTRPEQEDPNIAAAMNAAAGKPPAPQSLSERLAALKAR